MVVVIVGPCGAMLPGATLCVCVCVCSLYLYMHCIWECFDVGGPSFFLRATGHDYITNTYSSYYLSVYVDAILCTDVDTCFLMGLFDHSETN